jgi:hypothetical protein
MIACGEHISQGFPSGFHCRFLPTRAAGVESRCGEVSDMLAMMKEWEADQGRHS